MQWFNESTIKLNYSILFFFSSVKAEQPCLNNSNRYLVFFDDGSVAYLPVRHFNHIHSIVDSTTLPIERLSTDHIYFMRNYFDNYPERDLIRFKLNSQITVYIKDKWQKAVVNELDATLVKLKLIDQPLLLDHWLYRGSLRLLPIYEKLMKRLGTSSLHSSSLPFEV